ncbi:MAG: hypothetical protein K0Q79_1832 [Flavipsychrobacter sp.]|jgi:osmotically-inducible protein OsmY|nr:hypothetical protein [Flavipsychrobacter sp.]
MSTNKLRQTDPRTRTRTWDNTSFNSGIEDYQTENSSYDSREQDYYPRQTQQFTNDYPSQRFGSYENDPYAQNQYRNEWNEQRQPNYNTQNSPFYNERTQNSWNNRPQQFGSQQQYGNQSQYGNQYGQQPTYGGNQYGGYSQYGQTMDPQWDTRSQQMHNSTNQNRWNEDHNNPQSNYRNNQSWGQFMQRNTGTGSGNTGSNYGGNYSGGMGTYNRSENLAINERGSMHSNYGPHKGKGPKGYQRSAERIKEDLNDLLMDDGVLDASNIEVTIENNEVILSGTVASREEKRRAEDLAESITGVNNVENRLHVSRETESRERKSSLNTESNNESKSRRNSLVSSNS